MKLSLASVVALASLAIAAPAPGEGEIDVVAGRDVASPVEARFDSSTDLDSRDQRTYQHDRRWWLWSCDDIWWEGEPSKSAIRVSITLSEDVCGNGSTDCLKAAMTGSQLSPNNPLRWESSQVPDGRFKAEFSFGSPNAVRMAAPMLRDRWGIDCRWSSRNPSPEKPS